MGSETQSGERHEREIRAPGLREAERKASDASWAEKVAAEAKKKAEEQAHERATKAGDTESSYRSRRERRKALEAAYEVTGRTGAYVTAGAAYLNLDYIVQLGNNPLALRGPSRTIMAAWDLDGTTIGVDVSAFKEDAVAGRIVGVLLELPDAFSQAADAKPVRDRWRVSLAVNLQFAALGRTAN